MRPAVTVIVLVLALTGVAGAPPAAAGTFEVSACDAAPGFVNNSWRSEVTHRAMVVFNACPSADNPRFGLGGRHRFATRGTAPRGAATRWRFEAPPQTAIVGVRANTLFEQLNQRWQVGLFTRSRLVSGCPAGRLTGSICIGALSAADFVPLLPSDVLYTEVHCVYGPCPLGTSRRPSARGSMTFIRVTVADGTPPALANVSGDLWTGGWIGGTRQVTFNAADNTGIKEVRVSVDGAVKSAARRDCDPTLKVCPDWLGASLTVATTSGIPDGKHTLSLQAVDRGDNVGGPTREVLIDNTAPASPQDLGVVNGDGWKPTPQFEVRWTNPPQEFAPIAGVEYTLCPSPPLVADCVRGSKDGNSIQSLRGLQVPQPGEWLLTTWLRDEAGNARPETAAPPVHLRFDPTPPHVAIQPSDPENPSRVDVAAADDVSGLVRGEIEMRREGTQTWRRLDAVAVPGGFAAPVNDERLRDGVYELRAHAWDAAGNERSTTQLASGEPARLTLPLRVKTLLRVGKALKVRRSGARRGQRHRRTIYVTRPLIQHGGRVRLRGRLTAPGGNPLAGVPIDVAAKPGLPGAAFTPVATLTTSRTGRFNYLVPSGPSRVLRFHYAGAPKIRPQTREVEVRVRAASGIRPSRRAVVNGETVLFAGRLRSGAIPPGGKLVELQYFDRGQWRTFRTARAAADGLWRIAYRFDGTRGVRR